MGDSAIQEITSIRQRSIWGKLLGKRLAVGEFKKDIPLFKDLPLRNAFFGSNYPLHFGISLPPSLVFDLLKEDKDGIGGGIGSYGPLFSHD